MLKCLREQAYSFRKDVDVMDRHVIRRMMNQAKRKVLQTAGLAALLAGMWCVPAYADGWVQTEDAGWKYEENGVYAASGWREINGSWYYFDEEGMMQTGWVQAADDQLWYYLDTETGAWVRRPTLSDENVVKLLENAVRKAGYYQDEDGEVFYVVEWRNESIIHGAICERSGPNDLATLNMYDIHIKTGSVTAAVGGNFNIYG